MRQVLLILMLANFAIAARAQTPRPSTQNPPCKLTVAQSPAIRGVRLGMTTPELRAVFPDQPAQMAIDNAIKQAGFPVNFGVGRAKVFDSEWPNSDPRFTNVKNITVTLFDGRVSEFQISYLGPEWKSVDQFISKLSGAFHLPPAENWKGGPGGKLLECDGFAIDAYYAGGSSPSAVAVRDVSGPNIVSDRREAEKEKARQAFKP